MLGKKPKAAYKSLPEITFHKVDANTWMAWATYDNDFQVEITRTAAGTWEATQRGVLTSGKSYRAAGLAAYESHKTVRVA